MRVVALVVIGLVLFFSLLGLRGLCEPDEGRYAEIAREMVEGGDWLTPHLNYIKHFHKPPLVYWLSACSFKLFGINEFSARLPVALIGVAGLVITYLLAVRMGCGKATGFLSGLVLAATPQYFVWTQVLSSDMVFSFFILLAFYGFWKRSYLFFLGIAFAFMVKGPVAIIITTIVPVLYILISRETNFLKKGRVFTGIIIFLAIVSPWFIYVCLNNPGLLKYFVFNQSLDRMFTEMHGRGGNLFYFIPVVLLGGLPWVVFAPWALRIRDKTNLFLFLWIAVPVIFFSLSKSKLPGYILPVYPALAIITGRYFEEKKINKIHPRQAAKYFITRGIDCALIPAPTLRRDEVFSRRYKLFYALCVGIGALCLSAAGILPFYEEKLGDNLSIRKPAGIIKNCGGNKDKIVNFRCFLQGLPFYMKGRIIFVERRRETQFEKNPDSLKDYLIDDAAGFFKEIDKDDRMWIFTKKKDLNDLFSVFPGYLYEAWNGSDYILMTNKPVIGS